VYAERVSDNSIMAYCVYTSSVISVYVRMGVCPQGLAARLLQQDSCSKTLADS
jgi:hypothetical protein